MRRTYDARALPGPRRADPRARARLRAHHRHHRRLPGGDRGRLRARRSRSSRRSASTAPSPSSTRRGGTPRRPSSSTTSSPTRSQVERMERLVEVVQRRARERAQRFVGRTLDVLVEGPSRTTRRACAAARATTRSSTSTASPGRARSSRSRSPRPRARRCRGERIAARSLRRADRARSRFRPTAAMRTCVRALGITDIEAGRRGPPSRASGTRGRPPLRRAGGAGHALPRDPHQVGAQPRPGRVRACRSRGRSTRTGAAAMPAPTAWRARRRSCWPTGARARSRICASATAIYGTVARAATAAT